MKINRLTLSALVLSVFLTLLVYGFIETRNTFNHLLPDWTFWLFFSVITFAAFYYSSFFLLLGRIRKMKQRIEREGLSNDTFSLDGVSTLNELESRLNDWSEKQSELVQELKDREVFRRDYMGNVSHELKTPIFNIQGYIHTLLDGAYKDKEVAQKFLKRAAKSVDRMTELVKDLDVLSKVESGEYDIHIRPVLVQNIIEEALEEIENFAAKRGAKISLSLDLPSKTKVLCDAARIEQVLDNLLVNAIKYSGEPAMVDLKVLDEKGKVRFIVKDRGFGIPEGDLPHVFERFYRVDKARSRDAGGTGLGLSIVKHIIDRHGEIITVKSGEGIGSEFSFTLKKSL
jgi:two-component system phosphate regulon sensor histidine kinase PhoR